MLIGKACKKIIKIKAWKSQQGGRMEMRKSSNKPELMWQFPKYLIITSHTLSLRLFSLIFHPFLRHFSHFHTRGKQWNLPSLSGRAESNLWKGKLMAVILCYQKTFPSAASRYQEAAQLVDRWHNSAWSFSLTKHFVFVFLKSEGWISASHLMMGLMVKEWCHLIGH